MVTVFDKKVLPRIAEAEQTPAVHLLMAFIEQQQETIQQQQSEIEALKAELARLKKLPPKPKIKPSKLTRDTKKGSGNSCKFSKSKKKLIIHKTEIIKPDHLPDGSRLLGYEDYIIQDLVIEPHNTRYRLARYRTADGKSITAVLPDELQGSHFGITLQSYIIYQYYHQRVTQPLILQQLTEWGINISSGQISNILIQDKACFHAEKDELLTAGIHNSSYIHVDDTGSRHDGKNGYCTHVGNESFAWFASTGSKSRINFLTLLLGKAVDYTINSTALNYMSTQGLPQQPLTAIKQSDITTFAHEQQWQVYLQQLKITNNRHIRIATEGALLGTLSARGFPPDLVIISDDAGQFNILLHALCWYHADRVFQRIVPMNDIHAREIDWVHTRIWEIYAALKQYKQKQDTELKSAIEAQFDELCNAQTSFATLNQALKRLARNKEELLLVLERPDIPLQNNLSERDIREYVIKRKISGSTRSEDGRRCRDTFTSLKKTCKKQGISFWNFLCDRLRKKNAVPYLPDLLSSKA